MSELTPLPPKLLNNRSQSGKSHLALKMAEFWNIWCSSRPLASIVYVGEHISPEYRKSIEELGQRLQIKIFICVPHGLLNERFVASWKAKLAESGHITENEEKARKRPSGDESYSDTLNQGKGNEEEEEEEEEEEGDVDGEKQEERRGGDTEDECQEFIEGFLSKKPRAPRHKESRFLSGKRLKKNVLTPHPKIRGKSRDFLSLNDGDLGLKSFVALEGGRAITRSLAKQAPQTTLDPPPAPLAPPGKKKRRKGPEIVTPSTTETPPNDETVKNNPPSSSFKREYQRRLETAATSSSSDLPFPILPNTLILIDDALTCTSADGFENLNRKKEFQQQYMEKLLFLKGK